MCNFNRTAQFSGGFCDCVLCLQEMIALDSASFSSYWTKPGEQVAKRCLNAYFSLNETESPYSGTLYVCSMGILFVVDSASLIFRIDFCDMRKAKSTKKKFRNIPTSAFQLRICCNNLRSIQHNETKSSLGEFDVRIGMETLKTTFTDIERYIMDFMELEKLGKNEEILKIISELEKQSHGQIPMENVCGNSKALFVQQSERRKGYVVVTKDYIYFFSYAEQKMHSISLLSILLLVKKRIIGDDIGLEIVFQDRSTILSVFDSTNDRDNIYNAIIPLIKEPKIEDITTKWVNEEISNFEYLTYINIFAGRSSNDISQYPIFPWVIQDYRSHKLDLEDPKVFRNLTIPIGSLNSQLVSQMKQKNKDGKFCYPNSPSSLQNVAPLLVRKNQNLQLIFDKDDLFSFVSISELWQNCINWTPLREIIPEFYGGDGLFLQDLNNIGVGNVALPPWAGSPAEFVMTCRKALESDLVSSYLSDWIDLVFGYKADISKAGDFDNLYPSICYDAATKKIDDAPKRISLAKIGILPKQIFTKAHPKKKLKTLDCMKRLESDMTLYIGNIRKASEEKINSLEDLVREYESELKELRREKSTLSSDVENYKNLHKKSEEKVTKLKEIEEEMRLKIHEYVNQPVFKRLDSVNNFVLKLEQDVEEAKKAEKQALYTLELQRKESEANKKKLEESKQRCEKYFKEVCDLKKEIKNGEKGRQDVARLKKNLGEREETIKELKAKIAVLSKSK